MIRYSLPALAVFFLSLAGAQNASLKTPRAADGKPDFSGIYEWPKSSAAERCKCSATIFDKNIFLPLLKPGGEPIYEPPTGDPRHDEPRNFCMPAGFPSGMLSANAVQFVQNKNYLVIVHEFQRMTRVIPLDGRPHADAKIRLWLGDSRGHWEGDTLVVDTTNFNDKIISNSFNCCPGAGSNLHVVERFTRVSEDAIDYRYTVEDSSTYTRPWTAAVPMTKIEGPLYEYACHEGNYAMIGILSGARAKEKAAAEAANKGARVCDIEVEVKQPGGPPSSPRSGH